MIKFMTFVISRQLYFSVKKIFSVLSETAFSCKVLVAVQIRFNKISNSIAF